MADSIHSGDEGARREVAKADAEVRIVVADDDPVSLRLIEAALHQWGYPSRSAREGAEAWRILNEPGAKLAILDWMMPKMDGVEICRRARAALWHSDAYLILLTARKAGEDVVRGLEAGADDYLIKPFNREELRARVENGLRVIRLQARLAERVRELEEALARVQQLQGLLPICMYCKRIRDDQNYWQQVETYIADHTHAEFSHGVCPECYAKYVEPQLKKI